MRIKAVKLYEMHYAGKTSDLNSGEGGVPVYPIAIGRYRQQPQPCGITIQPAESQVTKIACVVSKYHADYLDGRVNYHNEYPGRGTAALKQIQRRAQTNEIPSVVKMYHDRYGPVDSGPLWEWTVRLLPSSKLLPVNEYEGAKVIADEWRMEMEVLDERRFKAQEAMRYARNMLVSALRDVGRDIDVSFAPATGDPANPFQQQWNRPAWSFSDGGQLVGTVNVNAHMYFKRQIRRRLVDSRVLDAIPAGATMQITVEGFLDLAATKRNPRPVAYNAQMKKFQAARAEWSATNEAFNKKATCQPAGVPDYYARNWY